MGPVLVVCNNLKIILSVLGNLKEASDVLVCALVCGVR